MPAPALITLATLIAMPCVEEARLAAASDSLKSMQAANAADPKVYEEDDPRLVSRRGASYIYEIRFLAYDDYEGGVWPAHERYEVEVRWNRKAKDKAGTCRVEKVSFVSSYY
jgi:hypothetical protein